MNINEMTIAEVRELKALMGDARQGEKHSIPVGEKVFIRTVTMHYVGRVRHVTDYDIVLDDASWVADSGRFGEALANGTLNEVEPYPGHCIVARGGVLDISPWLHALPRKAK